MYLYLPYNNIFNEITVVYRQVNNLNIIEKYKNHLKLDELD